MASKLVGHIGVDAGLCWIGDPCYVLPDHSKDVPGDWSAFCEMLGDDSPTLKSFRYRAGHEGLGVCVSTGYGDGFYPVTAEIGDDGRVRSVTVKFIGDDDGDIEALLNGEEVTDE